MPPSAPARSIVLLSHGALFIACSRPAKEMATADASAAATPAAIDGAAGAPPEGPILFALGPLPPDAPFEGRLSVEVSLLDDPARAAPSAYYFTVKGKKARWDLFSQGGRGGPVGYRVYDGEQHKFFTVTHQPAVYTTDEAALTATITSPRTWALRPFALEPAGKVLDMGCARQQTEDDQFQYEACLTSGLPTLPLQLLGDAMTRAVPFGGELQKRGLFPLNVVVRRRSGASRPASTALAARLTVVKIERGAVPDAAFAIPAYPATEAPTLVTPGRLAR